MTYDGVAFLLGFHGFSSRRSIAFEHLYYILFTLVIWYFGWNDLK